MTIFSFMLAVAKFLSNHELFCKALKTVEGDGNKRFCHCKDLTVSTERLGQDSEEKRKKPNLQISFCHLCQSMGKVQTRFEACDPQNHSDVSSTRQH